MEVNQEILYREKILARIRNGDGVTTEDRLWLATHRIINRTLGYPYLNTDIIPLEAKTTYGIRIQVEKIIYPGRIIPVITVPAGKGRIITTKLLADYKGNISSRKPVKMLGVLVGSNHRQSELMYQSDLGLLGISYECDFFDDRQHLALRKNSCVGDARFAMVSEKVAENKMLYRCKSPIDNSFETLVFSVEWNKTGDGVGGQGDGFA